MRTYRFMEWILLPALFAVAGLGCDNGGRILPTKGGLPTHVEKIPSPINLLLPKTLEIHPFTQTGTFNDSPGGIHARIQARDAFGDPTKAFGIMRFELYDFRTQNQEPKGARLGQWEISIATPDRNLTHWNRHFRSYEFKLGSNAPLMTGQRYILKATFISPFTPRLSTDRKIVAGE